MMDDAESLYEPRTQDVHTKIICMRQDSRIFPSRNQSASIQDSVTVADLLVLVREYETVMLDFLLLPDGQGGVVDVLSDEEVQDQMEIVVGEGHNRFAGLALLTKA